MKSQLLTVQFKRGQRSYIGRDGALRDASPEGPRRRAAHEFTRIRRRVFTFLPLILSCFLTPRLFAADTLSLSPQKQPDLSFRNELQHAIDRGLAWLQTNQDSNGWWSSPQDPGVTGLVVMSFQGNPTIKPGQPRPEWLDRAYAYILASAQPDGGIYRSNLYTYNTSICMMALLAADKPEYEPVLLKARRYLVGQQNQGNPGDPLDGGIGYGEHYGHPDMGNTLFALEALHYSKQLFQEVNGGIPVEVGFGR